MYTPISAREHHQHVLSTAAANQLVLQLHDQGIAACQSQDRSAVRSVLAQLIKSLSAVHDATTATLLRVLIEYCLIESVNGELATVRELLVGLRKAWHTPASCS